MNILLPRLSILAVVLLVVVQNWLETCWKKPCLNHTVFPEEESFRVTLALLAKFSISWGIINILESFALNPCLMT